MSGIRVGYQCCVLALIHWSREIKVNDGVISFSVWGAGVLGCWCW